MTEEEPAVWPEKKKKKEKKTTEEAVKDETEATRQVMKTEGRQLLRTVQWWATKTDRNEMWLFFKQLIVNIRARNSNSSNNNNKDKYLNNSSSVPSIQTE